MTAGRGKAGVYDLGQVDRIVERHGRSASEIVPILLDIQETFHYLPREALERVCVVAGITPAALTGIATFFSRFRTAPSGRHRIQVCLGTACHVQGAGDVLAAFRRRLGLAEGEDTDGEGLFTVEEVACLGCCMLAPAVQIDGITYGFVEAGKTPEVLHDFLRGEKAAARTGRRGGTPREAAAGEARTCLCTSCRSAGAEGVRDALDRVIQENRLPVAFKEVGCTGLTWQAPLVELLLPGGDIFRYGMARPEDARTILLRHFRPAGTLGRLEASISLLLDRIHGEEPGEPVLRYPGEARTPPPAAPQTRLATEHAGEMDPLDLDEYLAREGFAALGKCLRDFEPEEIVAQVTDSGLRGRGGAGFSTGEKWERVRTAAGGIKYLVCNGDEGDPGAFMDRMLLESFPFRVIEGMAIASRAVGAAEGFLYIRGEYPLAISRMEEALAICRERGFLGDGIMGSHHTFRVKVVVSAGAFVCGEETALLASIEGCRCNPRVRPPYPSERGLWEKPTLVNNVETLALVPWIIRHGPAAFRSLGTPGSKGTKTFALAGKVARGGLIEVPMGMTLREIVETMGGGVLGGRTLKAVQVGGPSGGCLPARLASTPVDYQALAAAGSMMGSGGMVVLDETDCMVDLARYFMSFARRESCGKCTFCRIGTKRMLEILDLLCRGKARGDQLEELERLARVTGKGSLCGLGRSAPNPVFSTMLHFREEYEAHLEGRCPARKCRALIHFHIDDGCIGCTRCAQRCLYQAIAADPYRKHVIDEAKCVRCGACRETCPVGAVQVV